MRSSSATNRCIGLGRKAQITKEPCNVLLVLLPIGLHSSNLVGIEVRSLPARRPLHDNGRLRCSEHCPSPAVSDRESNAEVKCEAGAAHQVTRTAEAVRVGACAEEGGA